jgi:cytosine/adenosine deaminase-related metal-dependent hydrolase
VQDVVRMLAAAPRALVIHGNYLTAGDLEIMAQLRDRLAIVYCPRTHAYFGHDPYPLAVMRRHGLRVALGTDSLASNPDLHVWREWVALVERHPDVHPSQALRCLTMDGAWALGWEDVLGTIEAGKLARLCVLPLEDESGTEPYECLRRSAHHLPAPVALPGAEANAATIESAPSGGGPSHG